jgi:hypothetical protein
MSVVDYVCEEDALCVRSLICSTTSLNGSD